MHPGGGITALIGVAKDAKHVGRLQAVRALGEITVASKEAVLTLGEVLKDQDPAFQDEVRLALRKLGPRARAAIPALLESLKDDSGPGAGSSAFTLGCVAREEDVPALLAALKDPDARVRGGVAYALGTMAAPERRFARPITLPETPGAPGRQGPPAPRADHPGEPSSAREQRGLKAAVPALVEALKDDEVAVREKAAFALGMIGPDAREAVPALIEAFKDTSQKSREGINRSVRGNAIEALRRIDAGAEAASAIPTLLELIRGKGAESPGHRFLALQAVGSIFAAQYGRDGTLIPQGAIDQGAEAAVPVLVGIIKKRGAEPAEVDLVIGVLGDIGPRARAAVPAIQGLIQDKSVALANERSSLVHALWSVSARDKTAVEVIRKLTKDPEECIRRAALELLELEAVQRIEKDEK